MAYLNTMVLRGAAPPRGAKKHAAPRGIGANLILHAALMGVYLSV